MPLLPTMATLCLRQELQRQSILPDGAQAMHTLSTQIGHQLDDEAVQGNGTAHEAHLFVQPVALGGFSNRQKLMKALG